MLVCAGCEASSETLDVGVSADGGVVFDVGVADGQIADVPEGNTPTLVNYWGGRGTGAGQFIEPSSVELDSDGFVYVAGHENRFQKFTADGALVEIIGVAGNGDGEFNHPHGLAIDRRRSDEIYVGDQENHRLQVFDKNGRFLRRWGDAEFVHIHDVGIDPITADVFVGDLELHTVRKFSSQGELLLTFGGPGTGPGEFDGVWGISTDSASNVYVVDTYNRRVQKFDSNGVFLTQWSGYNGTIFRKPTGIFVDARDRVFVCDSFTAEVLVFDSEGRPQERWNLTDIVGFRTEPEDIVVDPQGRHVYLGEVRQHRVLHLLVPEP